MHDKQTVTRVIVAVGYALVNKETNFGVAISTGEIVSYREMSKTQSEIKFQESPGYEVLAKQISEGKYEIYHNSTSVAELEIQGSSGYCRDKKNGGSYSVSLSSRSITAGEFAFEIK